MIFRNALYFTKEAVLGVSKNRWMTIASAGVTFATLLVLGIFIIFNSNLQVMIDELKSQVEIVAYLDLEAEEQHIDLVRDELLTIRGIKEIRYVSKEEALQRLREILGEYEDITAGFDERNPLPASFEIALEDPEQVGDIAQRIENIPFVDNVQYGQEVVEKLFTALNLIQWIGFSFMTIMFIMAVFLISNTIKLTVYARRKEITIMKFVGATDWFIRWPFIIEGLLLGAIGTGISLLILYYGYNYALETVYNNIPESMITIPLLTLDQIFPILVRYLTVLGLGLGALGSGISLRRFLKV
ncbi:permease-like cell division protein FtsX [Anaerobranca gottschalkii]|uniref:Cell division protein FtsX n=1 Tax=Anaerobranca gottschalkii DSM 13577 TaxID=1120990 RepID=A0A1H9ZHL3_9FIRM|nr:permease-like cell division protein FtsX [Anaerobranca gottschalkii]SES80560.1 cell division transport system permease protein [Anaerobranca gottschalkii DSM 13577]